MAKITGVYILTCVTNNKSYIGSSFDIVNRISVHFSKLKNNNHINKHLQRVYNKYGRESFEYKILCKCSKEELYEKEQYYIDIINPKLNILKTVIYTTFKKISSKGIEKIIKTSTERFLKFKEEGYGPIKLNNSKVKEIKKLIACGYTNKYISDLFKVTPNMISYIKQGVCWKEIPEYKIKKEDVLYKSSKKPCKYSDELLISLFKEFSSSKTNVQLSKEYNVCARMISSYKKRKLRSYIFNMIDNEKEK